MFQELILFLDIRTSPSNSKYIPHGGQTGGYQRQGWEQAKWVKGVERYKLPVIKYLHHRDVTYSMMTIVINTVLHIRKLLREKS